MKKRRLWILVVMLTLASFSMVGCKCGSATSSDNKESSSKKTSVESSDKDRESDDEELSSDEKDTESSDNTEESGESATEIDVSGETESGSEESTTPMEESSDVEVTSDSTTATKDSSTVKPTTTVGQTTTKPIATTTEPTTTKPVATTTTPTTTKPVVTTTTPTTTKSQETTTKKQETVTTATTTKNYGSIVNKGPYEVEKYTRRGMSEAAESAAENVINSILKTSMSEVQRVRAIHDWLVKNVYYDYQLAANIGSATGEELSFTAEGALVNKLAVCEGYSEAFLLLCWTAGIEARIVEGTSFDELGNSVGHEWNVVEIADKWYQIDVTWDDPGIVNGNTVTNDATGGNLRYDYFLLTESDMCKDHAIANCYNYTLPACTSKDYYEYAEQCTFEVKLGSVPFTKITTYEQAKSAIVSYNTGAIKTFSLIYPEGTLDLDTLCQVVVDTTIENASYYGNVAKVGVSASAGSSIGYTLPIFTLSITYR